MNKEKLTPEEAKRINSIHDRMVLDPLKAHIVVTDGQGNHTEYPLK